jgi:hypothetical protein
MLLYGDSRNIQDQCEIFNFTSYIEGYRRLCLLPPNGLGASTEYEFDQIYMNYILGNDSNFVAFFNIIQLLRAGRDVYLIVSNDDWSEMIIESLLKLIQQRYGYNATRINCIEDLFTAEPGDFNRSYGLFNYDTDAERYEEIMTRYNIMMKEQEKLKSYGS